MAQCKQTAQEFIQDAFSPMVAVLCSHDAELVCQKNNLSFVELVQPFCRLNTEAQIRYPGNIPHTIRNLHVKMRDMNEHPPHAAMAKKLTNEAVANALPPNMDNSRGNIITVGDFDIQLSVSTPWFDAYRETFLQVAMPSDHEFIKHFLGCIFVVSSSHPDPMEQFAKLAQQQHSQQHQQASKQVTWFCPNILRYYVLIHDVADEEGSKAEAVYQSMKSMYDANSCHLMQINSMSAQASETQSAEDMNLPDPWRKFLPNKTEQIDITSNNIEEEANIFPCRLRETNCVEEDVEAGMEVTEETEVQAQTSIIIDHPLAEETYSPPDLNSVALRDGMNNPLIPTSRSMDSIKSVQHGACLTLSDHDRIRIFVHEFIVRGLIPWAERMLRTLNEQVTTRRGLHRSLFSATKKWFSTGKPAVQTIMTEKTNVVYTPEAPEMQLRRLADLAFMFQLYEIAYQTFHAAKRDFNNDHAWMHYAGALEMACMSVFMQGRASQRQYPQPYMDSALTTYLTTCRLQQFATRATFLSTEALKSRGMYLEAALQYIKMTSEDCDLRSALLLEQAAHCFIKIKQPMVRKYSFHMILSGHRFSKAGQQRHALRAYTQALHIYKGKSWSLAEDHINFTIGRQSLNLKQQDNATAAFKHLLTVDSKQSAPQQTAFLREYLVVYKQQLAMAAGDGTSCTNGELPQLPLPMVDGNATKVLCGHLPGVRQGNKTPASSVCFDWDDSEIPKWQKLEELILISNPTNSLPLSRSTTLCYTSQTNNANNPLAVIEEPINVEVCLINPLKIPLVLTQVVLIWKFLPIDYTDESNQKKPPQMITNEVEAVVAPAVETFVSSQVLAEVILEGQERKLVQLSLSPHRTGELHIVGLAYNLGTTSANQNTSTPVVNGHNESTILPVTRASFVSSITVRGKQNLEVQGPRLNGTSAERAGKVYGPDRRLDLIIAPQMPCLQVHFVDFPRYMLSCEVRRLQIEFRNAGHLPLHNLKVASSHPELFTFGNRDMVPDSIRDDDRVYQSVRGEERHEFVTHSRDVKYVQTVPNPAGQLGPGQTLNCLLFIHAPASHGSFTLDFLFYYEPVSANPKIGHRILRHTTEVTLYPSLQLQAVATRASGCRRTEQQNCTSHSDLLVALQVENINMVREVNLQELSLVQVSCVSCQWSLQHINTQPNSDMKIGSRESKLLSFKTCRCRHRLDPETDKGKLIFTNVTFGQYQIDSSASPCADFYYGSKLDNRFEDLQVELPKQPALVVADPEPRVPDNVFEDLDSALQVGLTLLVLWKASLLQESGDNHVICGQHYVTLDVLDVSVSSPAVQKAPLEQPPVKIVKPLKTEVLPTADQEITERQLKYCLNYQRQVQHNFTQKRLCVVAVTVELNNCSPLELQVQIDTSHSSSSGEQPSVPVAQAHTILYQDKPSSMYSWVGQSRTSLRLEPDSSRTVDMRVCFCQPGTYDLGRLQISAGPVAPLYGFSVSAVQQRGLAPSLIVINQSTSGSS